MIVKMKNKIEGDSPPYPEDSPILISKDADLGWIVEAVNGGEYEIESDHFLYAKDIDFSTAIYLAKERKVELWMQIT